MSKLSRKRPTQHKVVTELATFKYDEEDDDFKTLSKPSIYREVTEVIDPTESELRIMKDTDVILLEEIEPASASVKCHDFNNDPVKIKTSNKMNLKNSKITSTAQQIPLTSDSETKVIKPDNVDPLLVDEDDSESKPKDKVVCPFCWKKLSDKLTGMSHVKNCGKNLPTERIFEALQLHEKQVREWEYLGITYPGFQQNTNKIGTGKTTNSRINANTGTARTNRRKKKDPELDLALALSASLHEEIEDRKRKEKNYLVEIGLEEETDKNVLQVSDEHTREMISDAKSKFRIRFGKETKIKLPKCLPCLTSGQEGENDADIVKRRGLRSKTNLTETPLYKITETERQAMVSTRVAEILEKNEQKNEFFGDHHMKEFTLPLGTNERLKSCTNEDSELWKLAATQQPKAGFVIPALIESKNRQTVIENTLKSSKTSTRKSSKELEKCADVKNNMITNSIHTKISRNSSEIQILKEPRSLMGRSSEPFGFNLADPEIPQVAQDLLKLFMDKTCSDLTLYGLEERPIHAHKLIIMARCPKLLQEIITEESISGKRREVIPLTSFSHAAVKSFVWFIYSGRFLPLSESIKDGNSKIEEEIRELCQIFNLSLSEAGVINSKNSNKHSVQSEIINKTPACKYVEKSVQTDEIKKSQESLDALTRHEKSGNGVNEVNVFNDSGDGLFELSGTKINPKKIDYEEEIASPKDWTRNFEENISNDGSCDLFEEYFPEEGNAKLDGEIMFNDSLKKRSRSLSPSWERSFDKSSTVLQATKRHKLNFADVNDMDDKNNVDQVCDEPSLIILGDSVTVDVGNNSNNIDKNLNSPVVFKHIEITNDLSCQSSPKKLENSCLSQFIDDFPYDTVAHPISFSPIDRNNLLSRISTPILSKKLSTIRESFDRFRGSSGHTSRPCLFSPIKPVHTNHFPSSPVVQDNEYVWDNDDSVLAKISDDFLDIPINPNPRSSDVPNSFEPVGPISKARSKEIVKSKNKDGGETRGRDRTKGKNMTVILPKTTQADTNKNLVADGFSTPHITITRSQPHRTPLLNYSTIDTPILKGELKKFGLKPLPRSKAKLLLRHIYTQTHK